MDLSRSNGIFTLRLRVSALGFVFAARGFPPAGSESSLGAVQSSVVHIQNGQSFQISFQTCEKL